MKILFIYPETPHTFWSFHHALKFISKKTSEPPLGLLTVAAMLPKTWEKKMVDMNVDKLKDQDIKWADYVFISGMNIHRECFRQAVKRCNDLGVKVVAGGPMVTTEPDNFPNVDYLVFGEAEGILSTVIQDIENNCLKPTYTATEFPDISTTPVPDWKLVKIKKYATMAVQYSRGCPFACDFCSVTLLNGHSPRTKTREQLLAEMQNLYDLGWRGDVFIVDDNFIGNKVKLKNEVLPALTNWQKKHNRPFHFTTEVSINLADDQELTELMVRAGFGHVFVGIETPSEDALKECGKAQNQGRDLLTSVKILQHKGLNVSGGFIVGFDSDKPSIFKDQINFIQKSGIVVAMVGLLTALSGTKLFQRLKSENRILRLSTGDNMDGTLNFIPKMDYNKLIEGYKNVVRHIYSPQEYYQRVKTFLINYQPPKIKVRLQFTYIKAFFKSIWILGIREKGQKYYWKILFFSLFKHPKKFAAAVSMSIYGYHFRHVVDKL